MMKNVNWIGIATLTKREIWRFSKVWNQTILAPVVTTMLFLAVLTLAMGAGHRVVQGLPFNQFIAPGLVMMAVLQNAYANTSSSLMLSKFQGVIIDVLMPPFKGWEVTLCMVTGGLVRGLCVGVAVMLAVYMVVPFSMVHPALALFYLVTSSTLLAILGMLSGIWATSFEHVAAATNYIITPLAFLSGTFYSIQALPEFWYHVCHFNPFFYMIDGFRYAMIGHTDGSIKIGMMVMIVSNLFFGWLAQHLFARGYRLKS